MAREGRSWSHRPDRIGCSECLGSLTYSERRVGFRGSSPRQRCRRARGDRLRREIFSFDRQSRIAFSTKPVAHVRPASRLFNRSAALALGTPSVSRRRSTPCLHRIWRRRGHAADHDAQVFIVNWLTYSPPRTPGLRPRLAFVMILGARRSVLGRGAPCAMSTTSTATSATRVAYLGAPLPPCGEMIRALGDLRPALVALRAWSRATQDPPDRARTTWSPELVTRPGSAITETGRLALYSTRNSSDGRVPGRAKESSQEHRPNTWSWHHPRLQARPRDARLRRARSTARPSAVKTASR